MIHEYNLERRYARAMLRSGNVALAYIARDIAGEIMREAKAFRVSITELTK